MRFELPQQSGAYRWWYADVSAGDFSAVFIFMVGSIFSARYSKALARGGLPKQHAAVNFALYHRGVRRQWVLSEYQNVGLSHDAQTLHIGQSWLRSLDDGTVMMHVADKTAPWGQPAEATLTLTPTVPSHPDTRLVDGLSHFWQPIAARAHASLSLPHHALKLEGRGYHDSNHGEVALGTDLTGWEWNRVHGPTGSTILYRPWGGADSIRVEVGVTHSLARVKAAGGDLTRTIWGHADTCCARRRCRADAARVVPILRAHRKRTTFTATAIGEVADFQRFHRPWVRWMASMRTRVERAA